jgi:cell shape-determining protein MreC
MDAPQFIDGFKQRFERFVQLYKSTKLENQKLKLQVTQLKAMCDERLAQIENLKEELEKNKVAKSFLVSGSNTKDAKLQINRIVREIDNCIALLNR